MKARFHPNSRWISRFRRASLILIPLLIACGPFFYQAPPPLSKYPERTAGKTWQQLLEESHPLPESSDSEALKDEVRETILRLPGLDRNEQLAAIRPLRERNQSGHYNRRIGNLLVEAVELIDARTPGFPEYLMDRIESIDQTYTRRPKPRWDENEEDHEKALKRHKLRVEAMTRSFEERIKQATPELEPNLRCRLASIQRMLGELELAHDGFTSITTTFPDHPRSEVARFMAGRCSLELARQCPEDERESLYQRAEDELNEYLESEKEKGRFINDAHGWLGAIATDKGHFGQALNRQVQRLEFQNTREVIRSTLRECDDLIGKLFDQSAESGFWDGDDASGIDQPDYHLLAGNSQISRLFLFHALDPAYQVHFPIYSGNESGDRGTLEFLKRNIISSAPFAHHSLRELGRAVRETGSALDPTSCLILGWAALRDDDPDQALALFDSGLESGDSDELLHARGRHALTTQASS